MKITLPEDCGNSPMNLYVQAFESALARGEQAWLEEHLAADFRFRQAGRTGELDRGAVLRGSELCFGGELAEFHLEGALNHGPSAAAWGHFVLASGTGFAFSDILSVNRRKGVLQVRSLRRYRVAQTG